MAHICCDHECLLVRWSDHSGAVWRGMCRWRRGEPSLGHARQSARRRRFFRSALGGGDMLLCVVLTDLSVSLIVRVGEGPDETAGVELG
jgi:hypothetical protein